VLRLRSGRIGLIALLFAVAGCSSGGSHASAPAAETTPVVVVTPTTAALPTAVRPTGAATRCPMVLPASPSSPGVGRLDISLVPIAAIRVDVCVYAASSSVALRGDVVFEGTDADTFENAANGVEGIDPVSGPRCEPGTAASVLVLASDGITVEQLLASRVGCRGVTNGLLSGAATPTWTTMLERAVALADACARRVGVRSSCTAVGLS